MTRCHRQALPPRPSFNARHDMKRFLGTIGMVRLPRRMCDGGLELRPVRISDGPFLVKAFALTGAVRMPEPVPRRAFYFWWFVRKTYSFAYCIVAVSHPIGFIGLYDLIPGKSAKMSLAIPEGAYRRSGFGRRAFRLVRENLVRHSVVETLSVEIKKENHGALRFAERMGFTLEEARKETVRLSLRLPDD
jgi:RimJ/RimL family protein N-acetyltransferase